MKKWICLLVLVVASPTFAQCYGGGSIYSCDDDYGNSYDVQKIGNSTYMDGYNSRTGNRWSQESHTYGSITETTGRAANGNSWNMTSQRIGDTTFIDGRDSNGNYFSKTCNQFGCY